MSVICGVRSEANMKLDLKRIHLPQLAVVVLIAAAAKLYYSTAGVSDLLWVLAPTTLLVELVTGELFTFEANAGYMIRDHSFLIAASCSGVNFMITAFLMLNLSRPGRTRKWMFIPGSMLASYLAAILANTVRIATALQIRSLDSESVWLNPDQLHRFEGIVIYFGFLLLLFFLSERVGSVDAPLLGNSPGLLRRMAFPLLVYYSVTLAVPLASLAFRGGSGSSGFLEHLLFVLIIPILLLLIFAALSFLIDRRSRYFQW